MKTRIKSFLEQRRQLIESLGAPLVLTLVLLLVIASSISANTTNQQHQQQAASAIANLAGPTAPKPLPLQLSQQEVVSSLASAEAAPASVGPAQSGDGQASSQGANSAQSNTNPIGPALQSATPPRLPKINIYASRSEVKKLLGIDSSINYVTNGQLNLYALGFTIPMGYHLSDMIFTWQNLAATNVNYSISLIIGNEKAVERPLINITRSGLIPRHEQVFKITLPCSGKLTDDVDFQVLINVTSQVPAWDERDGAAAAAADAQTNSDLQMARAVHQQQNELMSSNLINQTGGGGEQMLADETAAPRRPAMRQVWHVISIKRKKICTMHPVPVTPAPRPAPVWPPNQPPSTTTGVSGNFQPTAGGNILPAAPPLTPNSPNQQPNKQPERAVVVAPTAQPLASTSNKPIGQWQPQAGADQSTPEQPAHQPGWSLAGLPNAPQAGALPSRQPAHLNWPDGVRQASGPPPSQAPPVNDPIIDPLHPRLASNFEYGPAQPAAGLNPLLFTLILMALIISAALVALLVIGTASSSSSASLRRHPLDKLNALTNCLFRRTAGSRAQAKCTKAARSPVISSSSLVVGPNLTIKQAGFGTMGGFGPHSRAHHATLGPAANKSAVSSLSGLSTDSGSHHHQQHAKHQAGLYYYAKQQQQTNYSPYYHHYQCPPDLLIGANQSASPYHITMSNQQTTKLFLGANGATGYAVDNNYTITPPTTLGHNHHQHQQQARSDSSSVYQTIY